MKKSHLLAGLLLGAATFTSPALAQVTCDNASIEEGGGQSCSGETTPQNSGDEPIPATDSGGDDAELGSDQDPPSSDTGGDEDSGSGSDGGESQTSPG